MAGTPALAQTASATPTEVVVTGTRLKRKDAASVGPLETLTAVDIANSGASSVGDLLQKLPGAGVSLNSNGTQGTSYGASSINLRYLGGAEGSGNRVLVLVDGHRWVDGVGQRGFRDFVDLNTMPFGMIDNIEVLKDGASATYGADAIAGVVNIHTLKNFDGLKVQTKYGVSSRNDGGELSTVVNWGKSVGNTSFLVSASYLKDEPILTTDRKLTTTTLVPVTTAPTSPNGLYILPGLANNTYFGTAAGFASVATPAAYNGGTSYGTGALADNSYHTAALPGDYFNTQAQGIDAAGPSQRFGLFTRMTTHLADNLDLKVEALFNERRSSQLFSPVQLSIGGTRGTIKGLAIAKDQAFNPFGTANGVPAANALGFTASQAWQINLDTVDVGYRENVQDVKTYRLDAGLNGQTHLFNRDWSWDAYAGWSKNIIWTQGLNGINYEHLALALGDTARCASIAGCIPVNVFAPMTKAQADYIRYNAYETNYTELFNVAFNVSGTLFSLPAGDVGIAAGWEYRHDKAGDTPDTFVNATPVYLPSTDTTTSAQTRVATYGQYSLNEVYTELAVPVFKDVFLAKSLDISLSARYSDYDTVGGHSTSKIGIGWRPIQDILVRGTYSQGFRAPSILELYQGGRQTQFQGTDPCIGGAAAHPTLPGCAGVPSTYKQSDYYGGFLNGTVSGNIDLKPETADNYSFGVALTPSFAPGLSLTSDWYRIVIRDAISSQTATQILTLCANRGGVFCDLVQRDASTGAIVNLIQGAQNLNEIKTSGIDTTLRYDFKTKIGRFSSMLSTSYLGNFTTISPDPTGGPAIIDERAGKGDTPRATYPHWKGQTSVTWNNGPARLMWRGRFIGETTDVVNTVKDAKTKAVFYQDIEGGYLFDRHNLNLTVGISNIFDKMPPTSYANAPINFDIYTYDVRGRYLYTRLTASF